MRNIHRTVFSVVASFGLLGTLAFSTSAPAADAGGNIADVASLRLAAVTAPTLALDAAALADRDDFANDPAAADDAIQQPPSSLEELVDAQETADTVDAEQQCLAASVYFEAKGEPLRGQLAVAETVLNRAHSGRFPTSICGVVRQKGQFSFVRGGKIPTPVTTSKSWRQAVAIARIAQADLWHDVAPNALFFHASRISMRMGNATRIAQVGNHIFYR